MSDACSASRSGNPGGRAVAPACGARLARLRLAVVGLMTAGLVAGAIGAGGVGAPSAFAQQPATPNGKRECQTVRVCNLARNAAVRGCLSSYTCRTCRMVTARCKIGGSKVCQEMVCSWGG